MTINARPYESSLVVMSGGLDSTTTLYKALQNTNGPVKAIGFDYGQRHGKELMHAATLCADIGVQYEIVDITSITSFLAESGSSLVSDTAVPEGHYAEDNMKSTVVPNRNMIMASIAAGHAIAIGAESLWMGVHAGDHFIYPDCRPRFFNALNAAIVIGNEGFGPIGEQPLENLPSQYIVAPYINSTKADIAYDAFMLGVPIHRTWSCYKGDDIHCGKCGTCVERLEAIAEAQERVRSEIGANAVVEDQTEYEDDTFWKTVTA